MNDFGQAQAIVAPAELAIGDDQQSATLTLADRRTTMRLVAALQAAGYGAGWRTTDGAAFRVTVTLNT